MRVVVERFGQVALLVINAGSIRPLALAAPSATPLVAKVPLLEQLGIKGTAMTSWVIMIGPAGMPAEIVTRLNRELNVALKDAEVRAKLNSAGLEPAGGTAEAFRQLIQSESDKWGPIIRRIGVRVD